MPSNRIGPIRQPSRHPLVDGGQRSYTSIPIRPKTPTQRPSSRSSSGGPRMDSMEARTRYTYAGFFLVLCLVSFVVQTETAVYIQTHLHWNKAYCMLYMTHGSWTFLWPVQLLILRLRRRHLPWDVFWHKHTNLIRTTTYMVKHQTSRLNWQSTRWPVRYLFYTTAFTTVAVTVAGGSWYIAVDLTSASDLTAIYNCSAFFAYAFSIPLLHEPLRWSKVVAVGIAILGVLIVAYGGGDPESLNEPKNRSLGNTLIGCGSILYGLYQVLYKRYACPPKGTSSGRGVIFSNAMGSMMGLFTLTFLWFPLPLLHWLGWETFVLPRGELAMMCLVTIVANVSFTGSYLALVSLTSPVLSSVAALLTIFLVALVDELLPEPYRQPLTKSAVWGGLIIIVAFTLLSWETYREMNSTVEHERVATSDEEDEDVEL